MNIKNLLSNPKPYVKEGISRSKNIIRTIAYRGKTITCLICQWEGQKFFNGRCPKCNSLPRTRLIPFALSYFKLLKSPIRILHIAPNTNEYKFILGRIDENTEYDRLNIKKKKHINIVQDLTKTDLLKDTYDLAIAWHVLEHIPEDNKAINEVHRLLKPNGHFLVSVPIYPTGNQITYEDKNIQYKDYEKVHGHYDHCRSCGLDYYKRFERIGFSTEALHVKNLNAPDVSKHGLSEHHVVWSFKK